MQPRMRRASRRACEHDNHRNRERCEKTRLPPTNPDSTRTGERLDTWSAICTRMPLAGPPHSTIPQGALWSPTEWIGEFP
jgi:hypothetical protein